LRYIAHELGLAGAGETIEEQEKYLCLNVISLNNKN